MLDFTKAFDKVSRTKLLLKYHEYGIQGHVLHWIKAFLSNRSQTVVSENENSSHVPVTSGVTHGSVFGQILFLVYINYPPKHIKLNVSLFANDTVVYLAVSNHGDAKVLYEDLNRLNGHVSGTWNSIQALYCYACDKLKVGSPFAVYIIRPNHGYSK